MNVVASVVQPIGQRRPRQARSQSTWITSREPTATFGSRRDRDAYVNELAERFHRRLPDDVPF
jgi:hypothetical protein